MALLAILGAPAAEDQQQEVRAEFDLYAGEGSSVRFGLDANSQSEFRLEAPQ
jgi:hypothetical protein